MKNLHVLVIIKRWSGEAPRKSGRRPLAQSVGARRAGGPSCFSAHHIASLHSDFSYFFLLSFDCSSSGCSPGGRCGLPVRDPFAAYHTRGPPDATSCTIGLSIPPVGPGTSAGTLAVRTYQKRKVGMGGPAQDQHDVC